MRFGQDRRQASARPELENSQDPDKDVQDCLQRRFIIEAHFAGGSTPS
jgi:hypothetical protein